MYSYCNRTQVDIDNACKEYFIHKPLPLKDEHTQQPIKADGEHPVMYLREYRTAGSTWSLICEFADDAGNVVELPIIYCPRCGSKLSPW